MSNSLFEKAFSPACWSKDAATKKIRFQIPLYQRPYAWKPEQINQLLEDLWDAAFASHSPYYIGILSVAPTSYDSDLLDLIDGQQRITTLLLIGRTLYNKHPEVCWDAFLNGRLHLVGRIQDENYLNSIDKSEPENPNFRIAINTINSFLRAKDNIKVFSKFVFENTHFFLSQTPAGYGVIEKNQQFVRLNNRGRQLEKHEILKVNLLANVHKDKASWCAQTWNTCSQLGTEDEKVNNDNDSKEPNELRKILDGADAFDKKISERSERLYAPLLTFEEFLLIALKRFSAKLKLEDISFAIKPEDISFDSAKLLTFFKADDKEIKEIWNEDKTLIFFEFLDAQNQLLKDYFIQRDSQDMYKLKNPSVFDNQSDNFEQEKRKNLIVLQSYLYVSRPAHSWMKEAFDWLATNSEKKEELIVRFIEELEEIDNKYANDGRMSKDNFAEKGCELGCSTPHYWFYRLDYKLWKQGDEIFTVEGGNNIEGIATVREKFVFRRRNSVEHIQAQTSALGNNDKVDDSFANLALITVSQNSKLSNNLFGAKRELIKKWCADNTLPSLKLLHAFTYDNWDEGNKKDHMKMMCKALGFSDPADQSESPQPQP